MNAWIIQQRTALSLACHRLARTPVNTLLATPCHRYYAGIACWWSDVTQWLAKTGAEQQCHTTAFCLHGPLNADRKAATDIEASLKANPAVSDVRIMPRNKP